MKFVFSSKLKVGEIYYGAFSIQNRFFFCRAVLPSDDFSFSFGFVKLLPAQKKRN